MGYITDVTIRCREDAYSRFKAVWQQEKRFPRPTDLRQVDNDYYIQWAEVKWSNCYLDFNTSPGELIDTVCDSLDEIDTEKNPAASYCMCIIGEELENIEIRQNDYDYGLELVREAVIPLNGEQLDPNF